MNEQKVINIWETTHGKHEPFIEIELPTILTEPKDFDVDNDLSLEIGTCPACGGLFGVDWTYIEQVTDIIHCPMCCTEIHIIGG